MQARLLVVPLVALGLFAAGCVGPSETPASTAGAPLGLGMPDVAALVHTAGDNLSGAVALGLTPASFFIGHDAGEPTLGITKDGTIFYAASTFQNDVAGVPACTPDPPEPIPLGSTCLPRTDILKSEDGGKTWKDVTPYFPGGVVRMHPDTGDPMVYVDPATDRVFDIDQRLAVTCYTLSFSDDKGGSWMGSFPACLYPPADHQTIVAAKPRLLATTPAYPNVVYVCYNSIATTTCGRSLDGGMTFASTGPVGTQGIQPEQAELNVTDPTNPDPGPDFLCSALVGHLKAAPDGTVYLPRRQCEKPMVAITRDDGTTWELVQVSGKRAYNGGGTVGMDPTIAVDTQGGVYYVFQGDDGHMHLSHSKDAGKTWSEALDVLAPGLTVANLATIVAGDPGRVALAYVASDVEGGYSANQSVTRNATWDAYLAIIEDANTDKPRITTVRINDATDPIVRGPCGPGRCNNPGLTDFIDIDMDADGRPWVALVDNCVEKCAGPEGTYRDSRAAAGFVATLETGPSLLMSVGTLPPIHGATKAG